MSAVRLLGFVCSVSRAEASSEMRYLRALNNQSIKMALQLLLINQATPTQLVQCLLVVLLVSESTLMMAIASPPPLASSGMRFPEDRKWAEIENNNNNTAGITQQRQQLNQQRLPHQLESFNMEATGLGDLEEADAIRIMMRRSAAQKLQATGEPRPPLGQLRQMRKFLQGFRVMPRPQIQQHQRQQQPLKRKWTRTLQGQQFLARALANNRAALSSPAPRRVTGSYLARTKWTPPSGGGAKSQQRSKFNYHTQTPFMMLSRRSELAPQNDVPGNDVEAAAGAADPPEVEDRSVGAQEQLRDADEAGLASRFSLLTTRKIQPEELEMLDDGGTLFKLVNDLGASHETLNDWDKLVRLTRRAASDVARTNSPLGRRLEPEAEVVTELIKRANNELMRLLANNNNNNDDDDEADDESTTGSKNYSARFARAQVGDM